MNCLRFGDNLEFNELTDMPITSICGRPTSTLGLAAYPDQDPQCVQHSHQCGINFFFFYGAEYTNFLDELKPVVDARRDEIILASGSGSRTISGLRAARRKILSAARTEILDIFFAEYVNPGDDMEAVFNSGGVLDELLDWKDHGSIRYVGASAHDRKLAKRLAKDSRVDILMHRFNMAHRKSAVDVFPSALETQTPVIAFTATRWGTLLEQQPDSSAGPPTAVDCYRYCLAQSAIHLVLTAPKSMDELDENLRLLKSPRMNREDCDYWERFGDVVYQRGGGQAHDYESQWP